MKKLQMRWLAALLALMMLVPLSGCGEKVQDLDQIHIPDPVAQEIRRLEERIEQLEKQK